MEINIRLATLSDIDSVHSIWVELDQWLRSIGPPMWFPDEITRETAERYVDRGVLFVAEQSDSICGTFTYEVEDKLFWPEIPYGHSAYVHRLAVPRAYAGTGLSGAMLDWVIAQARLEGRQAIRLDCGAEREKLRKIYETYGFQLVDVRQIGHFYSALYQLPLTEA